MICSACLDFHHAQLYQPSSLFSTRSLQNAERDKPYKISTFVSTEKLCRHANARKRVVGFFTQLSKRGARELSRPTRFGFPRNFRRARLPMQFVKFQNATLDTRSAATFPKRASSGKTILSVSKNLERRKRFVFANTKRRTAELTWGETEFTQRQGKKLR